MTTNWQYETERARRALTAAQERIAELEAKQLRGENYFKDQCDKALREVRRLQDALIRVVEANHCDEAHKIARDALNGI